MSRLARLRFRHGYISERSVPGSWSPGPDDTVQETHDLNSACLRERECCSYVAHILQREAEGFDLMAVSLDNSVIARKDVFATAIDNELVLFDPDQGSYFGSGAVGDCIWSMISDERVVADICDALMEQFEVERATCEADVIEFLNALENRGLIKVS
ncbi:PqqD family peptide modification chaperone [Roseibacterium sp. SDUM158016]|uniref:PqqD family protein n=1 Tax=Roseicyclus sediminis TaxID=2980997 RepID=UPI0021D0FB19|nr:PqqD family protein [Roseibacterium sp. SDUM158016]MCU4653922.1 PqqD family peptide modification chaperone [Roseibacterium sp. SDUM158016]